MRRKITQLLLQLSMLLPVSAFAEGGCTLTLSHVSTNEFCPGYYDGSIDLTATGGIGTVTYQWSNGATTEDISVLTSGTYTVTATDQMGCVAYDTAVIAANYVLTVDLGADTVVCTFDNLVLDATTPGVTFYLWQDGSEDSIYEVDGPGLYMIYVQDDYGCYDDDSIYIDQFPIPDAAIASTQPGCGGPMGALDLTVTGGTMPFLYNWSNAMTTEDISSLGIGSYAVTVTDSNGCEAATSSIIVAPVNLSDYVPSEFLVCSSHNLQFTPLQYGIDFDGQYDYIEVADAAAIRPDTAFTVEAWISPTSSTGPVQTIMEKRTSGEDGYSIRYDPNSRFVTVRLQNGPLLSTFTNTTMLPLYQWTHVALVVDHSDVRLYVDGVQEAHVTYSGGVNPTIGTPLTIGGGPNRQSFMGRIDEVIHWNRSLPAAVVDELRLKNLPAAQPGVGLFLNFNEAPGGNEATDQSANGIMAQLVYLDTTRCWLQTNPMDMDFVWDFGDGTVNTAQAPYHGYLPRVFQTMNTMLTVSTSQGCTTTDSLMLPVHTPAVPFVGNDTADHYCMGDTIRLWGQFGYVNYMWNTGSTNDSIVVFTSGSYSLVADDGQGCIHTGNVDLQFNPNSTPLPVITPSGTVSICEGDTLTLDAGSGYAYYLWTNGDTTQTAAVSDSGVYQVTVRNGFGCERTSNGVHVVTYPGPPATITAVGNMLVASAGTTYQWYLNGTPIPGAVNSQIIPAQTGDYKVLVRGLGGCQDFSDPYTFVVGTLEPAAWGQAGLFPNPTGGDAQLWISLHQPTKATAAIIDLTGRELWQSEASLPAGEATIALPSATLAKGCYLVKLHVGKSQWITQLVRL